MSDLGSSAVEKGRSKWVGITVLGTQIHSPPLRVEKLLVVYSLMWTIRDLGTSAVAEGPSKWGLVDVLGRQVYAAPVCGTVVLVVIPK